MKTYGTKFRVGDVVRARSWSSDSYGVHIIARVGYITALRIYAPGQQYVIDEVCYYESEIDFVEVELL